jgi:hypothetical protein
VRRIKSLPISQIELAATAFSVCSIIIYLLILYQPKDVRTIKILHNDGQDLSYEDTHAICVSNRINLTGAWKGKSYYLLGGADKGIPNHQKYGLWSMIFGIIPGGIIFGAVHCCGWSFSFPTVQEQLLWRIASVATTSIPVTELVVIFIFSRIDEEDRRDWQYWTAGLTLLIPTFICVLARPFIMAEVFRSLFYLPSDPFISTWADNIPHVS